MFLIRDKPSFTIKLLALFLISTILFRTTGIIFKKELSEYVVLYPSDLFQPLNWYRFLTYPLESVGLAGWIRIASIILPAGYILERRTTKRILLIIILISVVLGGLLFTIINQNEEWNRPIASPGLISWGFWIAAITCGITQWKDLLLIEKVIVGLFLLSVINFDHSDFGYLIAQMGVVLAVLTFVLAFKVFQRKAMHNRVALAE